MDVDSPQPLAERTRALLSDIVKFAELARTVVARGRSAYYSDDLLPLAAEAVLLKLGEAVTRLPESFGAEHPEIQLREARQMRNFVAHRYEYIDKSIVWTALSVDVPLLAAQIQDVLRLGDNRPMTETPEDEFADAPLQILEDDETVPPRPEEELANMERAEPDLH